nr:helix-turn-helix transcriptional regulator [uncultured Oscillibacter sp.]
MEYYQKLKALREDLDISQKTIAKAIGTTQQQVYKYENGIQEMTVMRLKSLCEFYNISADYILGLPRGLRWPREPK